VIEFINEGKKGSIPKKIYGKCPKCDSKNSS